MYFKPGELKQGMVFHCPTEECAKKLIKCFYEMGYHWAGGKMECDMTYWEVYEENTCYKIQNNKSGKVITFSDKKFYENRGESIIDIPDNISQEEDIKVLFEVFLNEEELLENKELLAEILTEIFSQREAEHGQYRKKGSEVEWEYDVVFETTYSRELVGTFKTAKEAAYECEKLIKRNPAAKIYYKAWYKGKKKNMNLPIIDTYICKGKRKDNGEWIAGYLQRISEEIDLSIMIPGSGGEFYEIEPFTLCRSVGKEYMNGEKAFEGDIFESQCSGERMVLRYGTYQAYCPADKDFMDSVGFFAEAEGYPQMPIGDLSTYALKIGNIFDNPELLKADGTDQ